MSSATWRVQLTRTAERDVRRLDPPIRGRVETALRTLAEDPQRAGAPRKLTRISDWRALILLDPQARTITVTRVLPRGRAYRDA